MYSSRVLKVMIRRFAVGPARSLRWGRAWQSLAGNFTVMKGVPRSSVAAIQSELWTPVAAGDALGVPVNGKGVHRKPFAGLRLPTWVDASRAEQVNAEVTLRLHQQPGTEVAGVD